MHALDARLGAININDTLDDPFQPDILFRGFEASPVLGTPQGLAVYQNGVRINEAFGDTVNWDLLPSIAINKVLAGRSEITPPLCGKCDLGSLSPGNMAERAITIARAPSAPQTRCPTGCRRP